MGVRCEEGAEDGDGITVGILVEPKVGVVAVEDVALASTEEAGKVGDDSQEARVACESVSAVESEMAWGSVGVEWGAVL